MQSASDTKIRVTVGDRERDAGCLYAVQDVSSWLLVVVFRGFSSVFHLVLDSGGLATAITAFGHPAASGTASLTPEERTNFSDSVCTFNSCSYREDDEGAPSIMVSFSAPTY